jgi:hypothetical protein
MRLQGKLVNQKLVLAFVFWLGRGKGATFFGRPESGFIWHQPPPPCRQNSTPTRSKSCTWSALVARWAPHLPWPLRSVPWVCLQKSWWWHRQGNRWLEGSEDAVKLTTQNRQAQTEVCLLPLPWSSKPSRSHQETERNEKLNTGKTSPLMRLSQIISQRTFWND